MASTTKTKYCCITINTITLMNNCCIYSIMILTTPVSVIIVMISPVRLFLKQLYCDQPVFQNCSKFHFNKKVSVTTLNNIVNKKCVVGFVVRPIIIFVRVKSFSFFLSF